MRASNTAPESVYAGPSPSGSILVIEDDRERRKLLEVVLRDAGHRPIPVADGAVAPDLILADYNLPRGMDGLVAAAKIWQRSIASYRS